MAPVQETMDGLLRQHLEPSIMYLEDKSAGYGESFDATIVSEKFEGLSKLERHRAVLKALDISIKDIKSLKLACYTPTEWERREQHEPVDLHPVDYVHEKLQQTHHH